MKNVKQSTNIKLLSSSFLAIFVMLLMSSCNKNLADKTVPGNAQLSALGKSAPTEQTNGLVQVPFEETLFVPCANDGAGEDVIITGTTHFVYQMVWNDNGFHLVYHDNSQGISGTGLISGEKFSGSDGTQGTVSASWVDNKWTGTTIEQMKINGNKTRYTVRYKHHLVVTPDGKVTVSSNEKTVDCSTK